MTNPRQTMVGDLVLSMCVKRSDVEETISIF